MVRRPATPPSDTGPNASSSSSTMGFPSGLIRPGNSAGRGSRLSSFASIFFSRSPSLDFPVRRPGFLRTVALDHPSLEGLDLLTLDLLDRIGLGNVLDDVGGDEDVEVRFLAPLAFRLEEPSQKRD